MFDGSNYEEEKKSMDGLISFVLAGLSYVFLTISIVRGIVTEGAADKIYGIMCIAGFFCCISGFVFAVESWKEEGGFMTAKRGGIIVNVFAIVVYTILLIVGIF